ncbi:MAG: BMP family ABC transporter substrate-binding protein, partial [Acidimicrobiia bacterium]
GKEAALAMYEAGADVVFHAAGGSGAGLFEAAKETSDTSGSHVWAIGVDSDQINQVNEELKPFILTSMLKQVGVSVYTTIVAFVGTGTQSGVTVFELSNDGVGYSTTGGFVDDIVDQLEVLKASIIDGDLEVPTVPEG